MQHEPGEAPDAVAMDASVPTTYAVELFKGAYGLGIYFAAAQAGDGQRASALVDEKVPFYRLPSGALAPGEASGAIAPGDTLLAVSGLDVSSLRFPQVVEELRRVPQGPVTLLFQRRASNLEPSQQEPQKAETREPSEDDDQEDKLEEEVETQDPQTEEEGARGRRWGVFQRLSAGAAAVAAAVPVASPPVPSPSSSATTEATTTTATPELQELESKILELETALAREQKCRFLAERKNVLYRNELLRVSQENAALRDQSARRSHQQDRRETFVTSRLHLAI